MSKRTIKAKLRERVNGAVNEQLLNYIAENISQVAYMSGDKLCFAAQCSREELAAFMDHLGVANMLEFKGLLRDIAYGEAEGPDDVMERSLRSVVDMVVRYEMTNMSDFGTNLDIKLVDQLTRDILAASEVYVVGLRNSAPMAVYAVQILSKVGIKARQIGSAENYLDEVAGMDRSGLVLALGFSRYHKGTVSLLGMLKKNGFNIVAITDYPMSPLARVANYSFSLARSSHDYTISFLNVNMLLNVLAIYIGMQDKDALLNRLRQYDENAQGLEYYF